MKGLFLGAMICLTLAFACGKKGDPRAPELAIPRTISNLSARSAPSGISLTWSRPTDYVDGKEISQSCPDCPVPYRQLTTVNVEDQEKFVKQKQYRFDDQEVRPKAIYRYRISAQLFDGTLSAPSNEVEVARGEK